MAPDSAVAESPFYRLERRMLSQPWFQPERRRTALAIRLLQWDDPVSTQRQAAFFAFSVLLHGILLASGWHLPDHRPFNSAIEVDLTGPYEIVPPDAALLARPVRLGDSESQSDGRKPKSNEPLSPEPVSTAIGAAAQSPKEQVPSRKGSLTGVEEGGAEVALISLTAIPQLLNSKDLQSIVRTYYPENERLAGHEGRVTLDLHIDAGGNVTREDIVLSAGDAFDQAAVKIASLFKFRPARIGDRPVPVRLRQTISFQLEN